MAVMDVSERTNVYLHLLLHIVKSCDNMCLLLKRILFIKYGCFLRNGKLIER